MKRKLLTIMLSLIAALCLCFSLVACDKSGNSGNSGNNDQNTDNNVETDLWTVERLYAEAQAKGFEGSLDDLIALFKGDTGDQGPKGDKGDTGAQGPKGDKGDTGDDGKNGIGVKSVEVDENGHLKITLTDGTVLDAGKVTPDEAPAEEGTEGLQFQKIKDENGEYSLAVIGLGTAWDTDIIIPSTYRGLKVTAIGDSAFSASRGGLLTSIEIPNSVISIGSSAFFGRSELMDIVIPDSVTLIGASAFEGCSGLASMMIGNGVTSIGDSALKDCSGLTSITIPDSVTSIGGNVFMGCNSLNSITVGEKNSTYISQDGILYYKATGGFLHIPKAIKGMVTILNGVVLITNNTFSDCEGITSIAVPASVKSIGNNAFDDCSLLESITVDQGNQNYSSQDGILYNKAKTEFICIPAAIKGAISIPGSVTLIKDHTFESRFSLTNVTIESGVTEIGMRAFQYCISLANIELPDSVAKIGEGAFSDCFKLTSIVIPDGVALIDLFTFEGCSSLTSIVIPKSVMSIEEYAFSGCYRLVEVWNYSGLSIVVGSQNYGGVAQYAKQVYITNEPSKQTMTDDGYVFYEDENDSYLIAYRGNKTNLALPAQSPKGKDYQINPGAFMDCDSLESIEIPESVIEIGVDAFNYCSGLINVTFVNPKGWACFNYLSGSLTKTFTSEELSDTTTAAKYLKSEYCDCIWKRGE